MPKGQYKRTKKIRDSIRYNLKKYHDEQNKVKVKYYKKCLSSINVSDLSWLAGFFEGEGNIYIRKRKISQTGTDTETRFSIAQKNKNILLYIKKLLGCGAVHKASNGCHSYACVSKPFLRLFLPLLLVYIKMDKRRKEIIKCLKIIK